MDLLQDCDAKFQVCGYVCDAGSNINSNNSVSGGGDTRMKPGCASLQQAASQVLLLLFVMPKVSWPSQL